MQTRLDAAPRAEGTKVHWMFRDGERMPGSGFKAAEPEDAAATAARTPAISGRARFIGRPGYMRVRSARTSATNGFVTLYGP